MDSNSRLSSDELLGIVVPIAAYWAYSGVCMVLAAGRLGKYRLHSREEEETKNMVSKRDVVQGVLLQQLLQAVVAFLVFKATRHEGHPAAPPHTPFAVAARQFLVAMFVLDTWQYFWHRLMHANKFLYRHVHARHHRLVVPYAFGSQYNHPAEGLLVDTLGGAVAFAVSGMSPRTAVYFFSLCMVKGVDDHCGLWPPAGNLFHALFRNNAAYHDVHHQLCGSKYNFSQPFFVTWDRLLGTYMPYAVEKAPHGGLRVTPARDVRADAH